VEERMDLRAYFEEKNGRGILATADREGKVDLAVYGKPHFMEDGTIALIMADRLSHHNLQSNDHAAYMFMEDGAGYKGIRLFLTKINEEQDSDRLYAMRSKKYPSKKEEGKARFLVFFKIDKQLPLIGAEREDDTLT
jgi:hypothetical protein